ncbi:xylulose kinase [Subtercola sp. Z020]|uniref:xylulokinase n=1 Tax=Subtercola sp. Z020 TaxID=2080582 RepID=UPI000CE7876D|nr:FGGY family carbohydrate kinase [Subtercola sp. Z020]PPF85629.1 xylulose kinase [Subtercola sp. Z020]
MSGPVFVACDMGTTLIKAAVIDLDGQIVATAAVESVLDTPHPGVVEQDLLEMERQAHTAIRRAVEASGRAADVAGISFSSQMAGIGAVGDDFEPVMPFDSWLDSRCGTDIYEMAEHAETITRISGGPPTYSHGPKERWLKRTRPEVYARTAKFQVPGPFVSARLAGLPVDQAYIDTANLCFSNLSDTEHDRWSPELISLFGLDIEKLPRILSPTDLIGTVTEQASIQTGIPAGVPIAAGGGDQIVACLGAGIVEIGQASDSAGTASLFTMVIDRWSPDVADMAMVTSKSIVPGGFISFSYINGGGIGPEWMRQTIAHDPAPADEAFATLQRLAAEVPVGSGGLLWLPHFQGGVLPAKPYLRSGWVGATGSHTRAHLYRSMLEGIAFQYAAWADRAPAIIGRPLTEVRAMGGGSKSDLWVSIKADVLGVPFVRMPKAECALLGNALIAAAATGHIDDIGRAAASWHTLPQPLQPDAGRHARYAELREIFDLLSAQVDPVFRRLQQFSDVDARAAEDLPPATPSIEAEPAQNERRQ